MPPGHCSESQRDKVMLDGEPRARQSWHTELLTMSGDVRFNRSSSRPVPQFIDIPREAEAALIAGSRDASPVRGLTHNFYRYPARFSGSFARAAIEAFSRPGDVIMDPHVGGGTTLVEALALGRSAVGVDISELAEFVATVKTTVYTDRQLATLQSWAERLPAAINLHKWSIHFEDYFERGYYKHLDHPTRWRARKAIEQALGSALTLPPALRDFGRCVVLRAAQTALDGRKTTMPIPAFRQLIGKYAVEMVEAARLFRAEVVQHPTAPTAQMLRRSAAGIQDDERLFGSKPPRLVLTSPPYPGVHVLYHRWQVGGGRETAAPFWIANKLDGSGGSFYTMGDRKSATQDAYFASIEATMGSVAQLCDANTMVVQMLAFSNPKTQLARYLETMEAAGMDEVFLPALAREGDGRLWRTVPNRKWYSDQRGSTPASQEVVLIHRVCADKVTQPRRPHHSNPIHLHPNRLGSGSSGGSRARQHV